MLKGKLVVCDYTKTILNDGKTIMPNYIEVKDGKVYEWTSNDPENTNKNRKPWDLHNRVEYATKTEIPCPHSKEEIEICEGKHFVLKGAMGKYLAELAKKH